MVKGLIFDLIIGKETTHVPTVSAVAAASRISTLRFFSTTGYYLYL